MKQKKVVSWKPKGNLLGNQLQSIDPNKTLFIISAPYPIAYQTAFNLPKPDCNIPQNHFPIQITNSPLQHRVNRKLSLLEYIKQKLSAEITLFISDSNIDIDILQHDLSNELAYLGFPMYDEEGKRITSISNTILEIIPSKFPYLQSIPLPPREMIDNATATAATTLFKADRNRQNVERFRERNPTELKPRKPRKSKHSEIQQPIQQPIQQADCYKPSIFSSIPEMPEVESEVPE